MVVSPQKRHEEIRVKCQLRKRKKNRVWNSQFQNPSETGRKNGYRTTSFLEKKISLKTAGGKKTCKDDDVLRETNCKLFTTCECRPFLLTPATLIFAVAAARAAADSKRQYSLVASSHPALPPNVVRCNDETKSEVEDEEEEEEEEEEEANDDKSRAGIATTSIHTHTHTQAQEMPATRSGSSYGASELVLERLLKLLKENCSKEIEHSRILQQSLPMSLCR
jgi:hypothetical protein